ncbi:hypothetical protein, partial [Streptomyces anandii]|uniref:hypothetical protein n=1 Tax=Streptomyces anandii TaxID=285454 RepID=UPI001E49036A
APLEAAAAGAVAVLGHPSGMERLPLPQERPHSTGAEMGESLTRHLRHTLVTTKAAGQGRQVNRRFVRPGPQRDRVTS